MQQAAPSTIFRQASRPLLWAALSSAAACSDLPVPPPLLVAVDGGSDTDVTHGHIDASAKADTSPKTAAASSVASSCASGGCKPAVPHPCGSHKMALIPAGVFKMGCVPGDTLCHPNEFPQHSVYLNAYCIDKREVTVADYAAYAAAASKEKGWHPPETGSGFNWGMPGHNLHPINGITQKQAADYCAKMVPGGRLPTEAQWEKAARSGLQDKKYPWGDALLTCTPGLPNRAVWSQTKDGCGTGGTWPVGTGSTATAFGLFDLSGNVWEWTADFYLATYYGQSPGTDPKGPKGGTFYVVRGGSYAGDLANLRASRRGFEDAEDGTYQILGFRCARSYP